MISQYIITYQPTVVSSKNTENSKERLQILYYNNMREIIGVTVNSFGHLIWLVS
jgi:hypothetical protein